MKTNHQRGYKDPGSASTGFSVLSRKLTTGYAQVDYPDRSPYDGRRGDARSRSAAKRGLRTQERRDGKNLCRHFVEGP
jgi:hypothetical protein